MGKQQDQLYYNSFTNLDAQAVAHQQDQPVLLGDSYYWPDSWAQSPNDLQHLTETQTSNTSSPLQLPEPVKAGLVPGELEALSVQSIMTVADRRERQRTCKVNIEKREKQRMTHIAVERNRRKQMNHYLAVLRSLMPPAYAQRGDQASIVGGAINFVKELEQNLEYLEAQRKDGQYKKQQQPIEYELVPSWYDDQIQGDQSDEQPSVFSNFMTHPRQYSAGSWGGDCAKSWWTVRRQTGAADVEVRMVDNHAHLRVRSPRQPMQLLKLLAGLVALQLSILHLQVTTLDQTVLYCFSIKVQDNSQLHSENEIARAVHDLMAKIREETIFTF